MKKTQKFDYLNFEFLDIFSKFELLFLFQCFGYFYFLIFGIFFT